MTGRSDADGASIGGAFRRGWSGSRSASAGRAAYMERQALHRADQEDLTDEQTESVGLALMRLDEAMTRLKDHFDLNLDLLGTLLPEH